MFVATEGLTTLASGCLDGPHRKWLPAQSDQIHLQHKLIHLGPAAGYYEDHLTSWSTMFYMYNFSVGAEEAVVEQTAKTGRKRGKSRSTWPKYVLGIFSPWLFQVSHTDLYFGPINDHDTLGCFKKSKYFVFLLSVIRFQQQLSGRPGALSLIPDIWRSHQAVLQVYFDKGFVMEHQIPEAKVSSIFSSVWNSPVAPLQRPIVVYMHACK